MKNQSNEQEYNWHQDPNNWKLGGLYYNKEDKRTFLPKRNPEYGITLNFANPKTYLVILASGAFFGFILFMINKNK